jgi:DNA helicase TIP49 (TBP-interacting protein)
MSTFLFRQTPHFFDFAKSSKHLFVLFINCCSFRQVDKVDHVSMGAGHYNKRIEATNNYTVIELAPINATTTGRLLNTFQQVSRLKPDLREKVRAELERIVENMPKEACPAVHGQAEAYLKG